MGSDACRPEGLSEDFGFVEGLYRLTEEQAQAILEIRLHRLTAMEQDKLMEDYQGVLDEIADLTLNAMHPDLLVVRHPQSGAVDLLAQKVNCSVLNAGDGRHEHPTQALLDALTIMRAKGRLNRLNIAICGDIVHSRVARSNLILLGKMENRVRLVGPATLMPPDVAELGVEVYHDMEEGLQDVDVVMMLRLQKERMDGGFIPSEREYYHRYGLDRAKLDFAKSDAIVMHPGPMNRGVEIDGEIADDINRSVIQEQVEMGVAVRMAAMHLLARNMKNQRGVMV